MPYGYYDSDEDFLDEEFSEDEEFEEDEENYPTSKEYNRIYRQRYDYF